MNLYNFSDYAEMLKGKGLLVKDIAPSKADVIKNITYNSKDASADTLFTCKGLAFKEEYLYEALANGAIAYMAEKEYPTDSQIGALIVSDIRKAMAYVAEMFYEHSYNKLKMVAVTGTKGKSTTTYYLKYIFDAYLQSQMKKPSGVVSTIDIYDGVVHEESTLTTPEAFELHKHFYNAVNTELEYFFMEVSAQALKYDRVLSVNFDLGVFLNISEDHISPVEHPTFEDYFKSKLMLFNSAKVAVVSANTDYLDEVLNAASVCEKTITFGTTENADVYGYNIKKLGDEIHFNVRTKSFDAPFILTMPGLFNVENALAAIACAEYYNIPLKYMQEGLSIARSNGRMEIFKQENTNKIAIVDYAHNSLSFEKLFESIKEEYPGREISIVFGCPGCKAINRRKDLGELAGKHCDKVFITMEDPSLEDVHQIGLEVQKYVDKYDCESFVIDDRSEAIHQAVLLADENGIILITGKGNEMHQRIGSKLVPCKPDSEIAKAALLDASLQTQ